MTRPSVISPEQSLCSSTLTVTILSLVSLLAVELVRADVVKQADDGPTGGSVAALAIASTTPSTVYAGTSSGIFKSTNGGESWTGLH